MGFYRLAHGKGHGLDYLGHSRDRKICVIRDLFVICKREKRYGRDAY